MATASDWGSKDVGRYCLFCTINGHVSFEKCWIGGKAPKKQRSGCSPRWYCKRRFWVLRSMHWTRIIGISNDSRQDHGNHIQTASLRWTSCRRSICLYPSKNGGCTQSTENSKIGMSRHLDSSTTTQMAEICYGKSNLRKSSWNMAGRKFQIGNVSLFIVRKDCSYLCMWMTKLAGKKQNLDPMWKLFNEEVDLGELTSFLDHVYLSCTQRQCEISKDIVDNDRTMFESPISAGEGGREITVPSKSSYFFVVLWHGGSCKEMCGAILWVGKQDYSTTLQSICTMHRWPPLQRKINKICWRMVKCMLSNCSKMLIFGTNWTTWFFLWSLNKFARSSTKWTKACDKRLNRLIS